MGDFKLEERRILSVTKGGGCYYPSVRLLMHPLSVRLTYVFARLKVHPNLVSAAYTVLSLLTIWSFWAESYLLAFLFYWLRVVLDFTDGTLARYTGKESTFGAKLDLFVDYVFFPALWILFALRVHTLGYGAFTVLAASAYTLVVDRYVMPGLKSLTRREPLKQYLMDRGIIIGFAPFGIFEFWSLAFFAIGIPVTYYAVLPGVTCLDLCYRVYEVLRFRRPPEALR